MNGRRTELHVINLITCSKAEIQSPCSENRFLTYISQNHSSVTILINCVYVT